MGGCKEEGREGGGEKEGGEGGRDDSHSRVASSILKSYSSAKVNRIMWRARVQ